MEWLEEASFQNKQKISFFSYLWRIDENSNLKTVEYWTENEVIARTWWLYCCPEGKVHSGWCNHHQGQLTSQLLSVQEFPELLVKSLVTLNLLYRIIVPQKLENATNQDHTPPHPHTCTMFNGCTGTLVCFWVSIKTKSDYFQMMKIKWKLENMAILWTLSTLFYVSLQEISTIKQKF